MLVDYENEAEAATSMCPKRAIELLGVSEWDGRGKAAYNKGETFYNTPEHNQLIFR